MASPLAVSKALLVAAWLVWSACLPLTVTAGSLRVAVRIGVPVFAVPADWQAADAGELDWRWIPDIQGCAGVQVFNPSRRHERVLGAEMSSATGEVLWRSSEPVYVLARSRRLV